MSSTVFTGKNRTLERLKYRSENTYILSIIWKWKFIKLDSAECFCSIPINERNHNPILKIIN
jgi:hypothetical protein